MTWTIIGYLKISGWDWPLRAVLDCPLDENGRHLVICGSGTSYLKGSLERHSIDMAKLLDEEQARDVPAKRTYLDGRGAVWEFRRALEDPTFVAMVGDGTRGGDHEEEL